MLTLSALLLGRFITRHGILHSTNGNTVNMKDFSMQNSVFLDADEPKLKLPASPSLSPKELLADYYDSLPPTFTRSMIDKLFEGLISSDTQRNLDSAGLGPASYKSKKKVIYRTKLYLPWLEEYLFMRWADAPGPDETD